MSDQQITDVHISIGSSTTALFSFNSKWNGGCLVSWQGVGVGGKETGVDQRNRVRKRREGSVGLVDKDGAV